MKFISNRRPSNLCVPFEYERPEARLGQIIGGYQPVVPATNDDDIPLAIARHIRPLP